MTTHRNENSDYKYNRNVWNALARGGLSKCPNCGNGALYDGFIKVKDNCDSCGEELFHHRADDLPPYINIFLVGHIVVFFLMLASKYEWFDMWTITIGGAILCAISALVLMRPIKGMVVGAQWAMEMHGFGEEKVQKS